MSDEAEIPTHLPILDVPQFTTSDVETVTTLSTKALEHMLDPQKGRVQLRGNAANPGKGRRRMFRGKDVLTIETARVMSKVGFPQRWSRILTDQVVQRAAQLVSGHLMDPRPLAFALWPGEDGEDWAFTPVFAGNPADPIPLAVQLLDVDRLIKETVAKLRAIAEDTAPPSFKVEGPKREPSPYSPENDFFRMWAKDKEGRDVLVGLSHDETEWYMRDAERSIAGDSDPESGERYLKLHDKHQRAQFERSAAARTAKVGGERGEG